jgi:hypothetical protein
MFYKKALEPPFPDWLINECPVSPPPQLLKMEPREAIKNFLPLPPEFYFKTWRTGPDAPYIYIFICMLYE